MTPEQVVLFDEWLSTRPKQVSVMAKRFPPGTRFDIHGKVMHVISYYEDGGVSLSAVDPAADYEYSVAQREPVCECCVDKLEDLRL